MRKKKILQRLFGLHPHDIAVGLSKQDVATWLVGSFLASLLHFLVFLSRHFLAPFLVFSTSNVDGVLFFF
jgi:hypothetical protein